MSIWQVLYSNQWMVYPSAMEGFLNVLNRDSSLGPEELAKLIHGANYQNYLSKEGQPLAPQSLRVLGTTPKLQDTYETRILGKTAIIPMIGVVYPRASSSPSFGESVVLDEKSHDFKKVLNSAEVENIVFYADSPGGVTQSTADFSKEVFEARGKKKMTTFVSGMNASAMYYITSATDEIVGSSMSLNGNIGVIVAITKDPTLKTTYIVSKQSPKKVLDPETKQGKSEIQKIVDNLAQDFVDDVARNRGISSEDVIEKFDGGSIFTSKDALKIGMIDEISSFDSLINRLDTESNYKPIKSSLKGESMDLDTLKSKHPDLYNSIVTSGKAEGHKAGVAEGHKKGITEGHTAGVAAENKRIKDIEELESTPGASAVIKEHKFDSSQTNQSIAVLVLQSQSKNFEEKKGKNQEEKEELGQQAKEIDTGADSTNPSAQDEKDEAAAIEQMKIGASTVGNEY